MHARHPMTMLEQSLRPYVNADARRALEAFQTALSHVRAVHDWINNDGRFIFAGSVGDRYDLPAMLDSRGRTEGRGSAPVAISAIEGPGLPKWTAPDALMTIVAKIEGKTLAERIAGTGSAKDRLVRGALDIAFDPWRKDDGFAYGWMPRPMQQELREGVLAAFGYMLTKAVFTAEPRSDENDRLFALTGTFTSGIPWREAGAGNWLVITP